MARQSEISSTEKLLSLIRDEDVPPADSAARIPPPPPAPRRPRKFAWPRLSFAGEKITVGVGFGHNELKLVKVKRLAGNDWRLLDFRNVPLEPRLPPFGPGFADFLKPLLTEFCGPSPNVRIWCGLPSDRLEVRHLSIPKVPKKQVANAVYWSFRKEAPFDEKNTVLDFEVRGESLEKGVRKIAVLAYAAPRDKIQGLKALFASCGFALAGISLAPFANQNLFRTGLLTPVEKNVCLLNIGMDWSSIDVFSAGNLVLTREIRTGINSLVENILQAVNGAPGGTGIEFYDEETQAVLLDLREKEAITAAQAQKILFSLCADYPALTEQDAGHDLNGEQIFEMLLPALERLIKQLERTIKYHVSTFGGEGVGRIYLSGRLISCRRLISYVSEQVGLAGDVLDPLGPAGLFKKDGAAPPAGPRERIFYIPAMGLALSDDAYTPNFLLTQGHKEKLSSFARLNQVVLAAFLFLLVLGVGVAVWQRQLLKEKQDHKAQLQEQLRQYSPAADQELIQRLAARLKERQVALAAYGQRYKGLAIIGALTELTPTDIALHGGLLRLAPPAAGQDDQARPVLILEGSVSGERRMLESYLAGYLVALAGSPLFEQPVLRRKTLETYNDAEVLRFTINLQIL